MWERFIKLGYYINGPAVLCQRERAGEWLGAQSDGSAGLGRPPNRTAPGEAPGMGGRVLTANLIIFALDRCPARRRNCVNEAVGHLQPRAEFHGDSIATKIERQEILVGIKRREEALARSLVPDAFFLTRTANLTGLNTPSKFQPDS